MDFECVIKGENVSKNFKPFTLDIPEFKVPKGFATALIGENGAGKTTLLNMLAGIRLDYKGDITFFGEYSSEEKEKSVDVKNRIGYTGTGRYYLPQWTVSDIEEISSLMFDNFDKAANTWIGMKHITDVMNVNLGIMAAFGYAAVILGGVLEYVLSSVLYRKPLSEFALNGIAKGMGK